MLTREVIFFVIFAVAMSTIRLSETEKIERLFKES